MTSKPVSAAGPRPDATRDVHEARDVHGTREIHAARDLADPFADAVAAIEATADPARSRRVLERLDHLTKPIGALGRLEALAVAIALIQRSDRPRLQHPTMLLFAADHGIATEGVSAYPREVTAQMVANIVGGGAAINVLCRQHGIDLNVVDVGVLPGGPAADDAEVANSAEAANGAEARLVRASVAAGTADLRHGAAMTPEQCRRALDVGRAQVAASAADAILLGEMGIGNTSSAALLTAWASGMAIEACVGRGTGLDDAGLLRKQAILAQAWARHGAIADPLAALAAMGGLEIAALVGAIIEAARRRRVIVIDGFVVTAALLIARRIVPAVIDYCVLAHRSAETGHGPALTDLGAAPLLDLSMRLGEGSGAALAWPLIASSLKLLEEMATFASAGVSTQAADAGAADASNSTGDR